MHANNDRRPEEPTSTKLPRHDWVTDWGLPPDDAPPTGTTIPTPPRPNPSRPTAASAQVPVGVWLD